MVYVRENKNKKFLTYVEVKLRVYCQETLPRVQGTWAKGHSGVEWETKEKDGNECTNKKPRRCTWCRINMLWLKSKARLKNMDIIK